MTIDTAFALRTVPADRLGDYLELVATSSRYANHLDYARGDVPFALWLALTDRRVTRRVGLGIFDLSDAPFADYFEDGMTPAEAADAVLEADDTFGGYDF